MKDKMINLRVPYTLAENYKKFCEESSFTMSKRIRRLMELDMQRWKDKKDAEKKNDDGLA